MKKWLITICLAAILLTGGCLETFALIGGGAAGGITLDRVLQQAAADANKNIEFLEAQNVELKQQLLEADTDVEKQAIRAEIEANLKWLDQLKILQLGLQGGRQGLTVDWKSPEAVLMFISGGLIPGLLAYLQWRKKNRLNTALKEVVVGGEILKRYGNGETTMAFKNAQKTAQQTPITRKLVAEIKAV